MNLKDRANLILINSNCFCSNIQMNNNEILDLKKFHSTIENFFSEESYMISIFKNYFEEIKYKKIKPNKLNFSEIYDKNNKNVEEMFSELIQLINSESNIFDSSFKTLSEKYNNLTDILYNNYVIPKTILKKELGKNKYIDFIFKIAVFSYINNELNANKNFSKDNAKELMNKLERSYEKLKKDDSLEIYEKILLLINVVLSDLFKEDDEIHYYNIKKIDKESPLFLSISFLKEFINDLDSDSNFYFPLLLIDGGLFSFKYQYDLTIPLWLTTFGVNMNSIEDIKRHLNDLIPNIVLYSDNFETEDYSYIMPEVGIAKLNTKL